MRNTSVRVVAALVICLLPYQTTFASADEARKVFDSLFAAKIKAVTTTADRSDDIALGKEMLAIAKTSEAQPELLALLCDQVHDLCIKHADGFATAVEAQQLLADQVETKRAGAQEKLTTLLTRQMTTGKADERETAGESLIALLISMGDEKYEKKQYAEAAGDYRRAVTVATQRKSASLEEAKAKLESAAARDRAVKNLARLQEKLLKDANDFATAEEIVKIHIFEFDDPASAATYLNRARDEQLKKLVLLAMKDVSGLSSDEAMELADWYKQTVSIGRTNDAFIGIVRAERYLNHCLADASSSGIVRTKADVLLKEIQTAKLRFAPGGSPSGKPLELLRAAVLVYTFDKQTISKRNSVITIRDISGNGNDGECDDVKVSLGINGNALLLDSAEMVIRSKKNVGISGASPRTVAFWIKVPKEQAQAPLGSCISWGENSRGAQFGIGPWKGQFMLWGYGEHHDWLDAAPVSDEWQHHIVTYDERTVRWYVNGEAVKKTFDHRYQTKDSYLKLGGVPAGLIDELAIFNRALTNEEVKTLFQVSKGGLAKQYRQ